MIAQSLASLDRIYGPEGRESLENGAGLKLYITPRDQRTVKEVSASVGSTTREAVTRMYGRNKGFLGATSTSARLEERPLLSETEARLMDPDEVIILASPQHPIKAHRIKYYDDPLFKAMVEKQEGKPFPYPPSVEGVGPWGAEDDVDTDTDEGQRKAGPNLVRDRSGRREARGMNSMAGEPVRNQPVPEDLEREAFVPKGWEDELDRQEDFIEELLGS
jgi:type IV secretion system protein VirD4